MQQMNMDNPEKQSDETQEPVYVTEDEKIEWIFGYSVATILCWAIGIVVIGLPKYFLYGFPPVIMIVCLFVSGLVVYIATSVFILAQLPDAIRYHDTKRLKWVLWGSAIFIGILTGLLL